MLSQDFEVSYLFVFFGICRMQRNSIPIRLECGAAADWSDGIEFNVAEQMVLDRFVDAD